MEYMVCPKCGQVYIPMTQKCDECKTLLITLEEWDKRKKEQK